MILLRKRHQSTVGVGVDSRFIAIDHVQVREIAIPWVGGVGIPNRRKSPQDKENITKSILQSTDISPPIEGDFYKSKLGYDVLPFQQVRCLLLSSIFFILILL
ncbi:hypothetical protein L3X38_012323 [Prunus dulcis]|uniref:Uncharacterized protein n=1 Tax=Prunus dulcis TaxID=3755 RepID=A0AAD4WLI5_PRUDU|nr:hypothetical protein L3X38_012323 [Prunus dulcis]